MKRLAGSAFVFGVVLLGCSQPGEGLGSSESAVLTDVVSMVQRADGRFDVHCRGKDGAADFLEIATQAEIQDNSVCSPPAPPGPNTIPAKDRSFPITNSLSDRVIATWGTDGLWQGFLSAEITFTGDEAGSQDTAKLIDGSGATFQLPKGTVRFDRLPTPVQIRASSDSSVEANITATRVSVEVTQTAPALTNAAFKYAGTSLSTTSTTLAADLPGVLVTVSANAQFFANFTNGNACSRLVLTGGAQSVTLEPSEPARRVALVAPIRVQATRTCVSSPSTTPENATSDVSIAFERPTLSAQ